VRPHRPTKSKPKEVRTLSAQPTQVTNRLNISNLIPNSQRSHRSSARSKETSGPSRSQMTAIYRHAQCE
jgi:hypothetical protein